MGEHATRPTAFGMRARISTGILAAFVLAWLYLDLSVFGLLPSGGGLAIARDFFGAALRPALDYEAGWVPSGSPAFLVRVFDALWRTVVFAAAAMSLALPAGGVLGLLASASWWATDPATAKSAARQRVASGARWFARVVIALLRSVHEFLWALIFLAAVGLNTAGAVLALALPFSGVLAKVFSEMLDEAPGDTEEAMRAAGASSLGSFLWGRVPRAFPDMAAYALYRFECAVRSSAVLGFFGYGTLGYYVRASFSNLHYREVWSFLYALAILVLALEAWSGSMRKRLVL